MSEIFTSYGFLQINCNISNRSRDIGKMIVSTKDNSAAELQSCTCGTNWLFQEKSAFLILILESLLNGSYLGQSSLVNI